MDAFADFIKIIENYIALFDELIPIEQEKLDAAVKNRPTFLEDCMNKEQAAILRMRGLEQKREAAQESLGMKDYKFREILKQAPEEVSSVLKPLFDQLSERIRLFRSINDSAKDAINLNLHMIQSALAAKSGESHHPDDNPKGSSSRHFTNRFV